MSQKKIIIIGGGVSGLSTGIYGRMNNFDTHILEMHHTTGGQCTAWERGGYHFDYCLQWLAGSRRNPFHDIWRETHVLTDEVKVIQDEVYMHVEDETEGSFYIYADTDQWQQYLLRMAPQDEKGIYKMCNHIRKFAAFAPAGDISAHGSFVDYMKTFFHQPGTVLDMLHLGGLSAAEYFDSLDISHPRLRYFLMKMFGQDNFSAIVFVMMLGWAHDKNAGYLVGGSLAISRRMTELYGALGGTLYLQERVEKILIQDDKAVGVRLSDGREMYADYVVSAADGHTTIYSMLDGKYTGPEFENAYKNMKLFTPLVQVSFGINDVVRSESMMTNYWVKEMKIGNFPVQRGYTIMNQTMHDDTLAPAGKTSMVLRFESPWQQWENVPKENYEREKELIRKDAIALLEMHYPGISDRIEVTDVSTPLTGHRLTGVWKGSYEGFMPSGNVMNMTLPDHLPGLSHFYMVGQWVNPGGGLPPSVQSGKQIINTLCKENHMVFKTAELVH